MRFRSLFSFPQKRSSVLTLAFLRATCGGANMRAPEDEEDAAVAEGGAAAAEADGAFDGAILGMSTNRRFLA